MRRLPKVVLKEEGRFPVDLDELERHRRLWDEVLSEVEEQPRAEVQLVLTMEAAEVSREAVTPASVVARDGYVPAPEPQLRAYLDRVAEEEIGLELDTFLDFDLKVTPAHRIWRFSQPVTHVEGGVGTFYVQTPGGLLRWSPGTPATELVEILPVGSSTEPYEEELLLEVRARTAIWRRIT